MAAAAPIAVREALQLSAIGVNSASIAFSTVTMESEKYILVREQGQSNTLVIVDMSNPTQPVRRPITADSALMNPQQKIVALKAAIQSGGDNLQIFNLDTKQKLKSHEMPQGVAFWKWISDTKLGLVTGTEIFHWDMNGTGGPVKVFDREANLQSSQIINYRVDPTEKWCILIGIAPGPAERPNLIKGFMQLYSVDQQRSQALEAHAAAFSRIQVAGRDQQSIVIAFAQKTLKDGQITSKLHVIEVGAPAGQPAIKKNADLFFPQEFADDFPVALQIDERFKLIYVITKFGLLFVYDLETATAVYRNRVSQDPVFLTAPGSANGGVYALNRKGQVLSMGVNEATMVNFVSNQLKNVDLALAIAKRGNLPGAENLVVQQFEQYFTSGQYKQAAEVAADSPMGILRKRETIDRLKSVPAPPGEKAPVLVYFGSLLQKGKLNQLEAVEIAKLVVGQNKGSLLKTWWGQDKLEASEELGDIAKQSGDLDLAIAIYERCGSSQKVVSCYAEKGDIEKLVQFSSTTPGAQPDYLYLLQSLMMSNPEGAVGLAKKIAKENPPPVDLNTLSDLFLQRNMVREATAVVLDAVNGDDPKTANLQTKILEINLVTGHTQVADAILANGQFKHYDQPRIAQMCEKAGLYMRALQLYTDLPDIKRVIINTHAMDPAQLTEFFGSLQPEWALECMGDLLSTNLTANLQLVVNIAKDYTEYLTVEKVIELLESHNTYQGLFLYLGGLVNQTEDPEVVYKYVEAASKAGQLKEVERITRENDLYPPERVKNFLMEAKLPDARPLINVCDRFDMVGDLTTYLYANNMKRFIEGYVQKVNPKNTPQVVGALLDAEAPEDFINNLILSVRALVPVDKLVEEVEQRNRLKILKPFLDHLVQEGSQDSQVHNAVGKITIDTNNNPEHFLTTNPYYDSAVVGSYCEKRDPHLAVVAYKRGNCDDLLVECTNKHSLFKVQARYIVERMDPELWSKVLTPDNQYRRQLVDQVVSTALPESKNPEQVSVTVKAFMQAELQAELIELLEKIVLQNSAFSNNPNLQNLLIITAIKSDPSRVKDYVNRLDSFDSVQVSEIAIKGELYEEAFLMYKKFDHHVPAIKILLENIGDLARGEEYASKIDQAPVWSELAHAQLAHSMVPEAISSYLKAGDSSKHAEVIEAAKSAGCFQDLVSYLLMARKKVKDSIVDTEIVFAYAGTEQYSALEEFIKGSHKANLQSCGDRCFDQGMFEAARVIYAHISNWGRLASTYVHLGRFQDAVDSARKANSPKTWKEVCFACVDRGEFKLAQLCALNIIVNADDMEELSEYYQRLGHFDQLIAVLDSGIGLERAHMGIFTELGLLYSRYRPEKLMEHLKLFATRLNIPRLIRSCEEQQHWRELQFLYVQYDEYDNALGVMMQHSPDAWEHVLFKDVAVKVTNNEVLYRAITYYLDEHPDLLNDLLKVIEARVDHSRVVDIHRNAQHLPLIKEYLLTVQKNDLPAVNEAVNDLLIDEEDFEGLRNSIETYTNFDQIALASRLEKHELLEFRRVAILIYKRSSKWSKAVELAKGDDMFKDATETAAQSGDQDLVLELLQFYVSKGEKEHFAMCLYTCYNHLKPDVVMQIALVNGLMEYIMPYMIQVVSDYTGKVDRLIAERDQARQAQQDAEDALKQQEANMNAMSYPLALMAPTPTGGPQPGQPNPMPFQQPPVGGMPGQQQFMPNQQGGFGGMQ
eukprot:TRINITY_DN3781_c1_g3_i1.p1 TRINITY_DN3781_c1_g3~~TRINITY_DN3781_c1_g3_i1.p1  ORF type:complete len:1706 (-),score=246.11 TRINITY_DN3781_c1_g3_i1:418-5535(-)